MMTERSDLLDIWIAEQAAGIRSLVGLEVLAWRGREQALSEDDDGFPIWRIRGIDMVQFDRLEIVTKGSFIPITTVQVDDEFGLWLPLAERTGSSQTSGIERPIPVAHSPFADDPKSIFRDVIVRLPVGVVEDAVLQLGEVPGYIRSITLVIGGRTISMKAGEVYLQADGSFTVGEYDESVLVQVDEGHPDLFELAG